MKKAFAILGMLVGLLLLMVGLTAGAEAPMLGSAYEGTLTRQDGTPFSYQVPQLVVSSESDEQINQELRILPEHLSVDEDAASVRFSVAHVSPRYLSVELMLVFQSGNGGQERISSVTFARDGLYAGERLKLSQVLGLETEEEQQSVAASLAYTLIEQMVEEERQNPESGYLEGFNRRELERVFSPEEDFYLDEDGNVVFYIQSGEIAGDVAGILRFPFSPAELLSVM